MTAREALKRTVDPSVAMHILPDPPDCIFNPKCIYAVAADGEAWVLA